MARSPDSGNRSDRLFRVRREMPSQANVKADAVFDLLPPDCQVPVDDQLVVDLACMFGDVKPLVWMSGRGVEVEVAGGDGAQLGRAGEFV